MDIKSMLSSTAVRVTGFTGLRLAANRLIKDIGEIRSLDVIGRGLTAKVVLSGLEDREITVTCEDVNISADDKVIHFGRFGSDLPFVEKMLNSFVSGTYPIPADSLVSGALSGLRTLIGKEIF